MSAREDFEEHVMPNGDCCYYRDSDHSYFERIEPVKKSRPDGEWKGCARLTGVSTVSAPFDWEPDGLMRWAARTNGVGVAELIADSLDLLLDNFDQESPESAFAWAENERTIWNALSDAKLTYADLRDEASERGTNVHKHALHALATGKPVPDYHELSEIEKGYANGVADFWLAHAPTPVHAELVVMDPRLKVAGRLDLIARLTGVCGRPECPCRRVAPKDFVLLDAKTSGYIPTKHHVQIAGYKHCAEVSGYGETDWEFILQVDEDGGWELIPARATHEHFEMAVATYRGAAEINRMARADRKERDREAS